MAAAKHHYPRTQHRLCMAANLAALLLCAASVGLAQAPSNPAAASYEVIRVGGGSAGSGTAIHPQIVVTNSHVVGHRAGGRWTVRHPVTKKKTVGKCFTVDPTADIALIRVDDKLPYALLDARGLKVGASVERFGNGLSGGLRRIKCKVKRRDRVNRIALTYPAVAGDSGGGCFVDGMFAGILHRTSGNKFVYNSGSESYVTDASEVVKLVSKYDEDAQTRLFGKIFGRQNYRGCPDGSCPIPQRRGGVPQHREKIDIDDINNGNGPQPKLDPSIGSGEVPEAPGHKHDFKIDIDEIAKKVAPLVDVDVDYDDVTKVVASRVEYDIRSKIPDEVKKVVDGLDLPSKSDMLTQKQVIAIATQVFEQLMPQAAQQIQDQLPPVTISYLGKGGEVVTTDQAKLGQPIYINPITVDVIRASEDGKKFIQRQTQPLSGAKFNFDFRPPELIGK